LSTSQQISPLVRCALMVRSLDRSRRFYKEFLGLTETFLPPSDLSASAAPGLLKLPPNTSLRATILKAPGPNFGMVGLFEIGEERADPAHRNRIEIGETVLVFRCSDVPGKLARLEEFGGRLVSSPATFHLPGASFAPLTEAILRDPDGYAINLIETSPALAYDDTPVTFQRDSG
jgi:catechol 2,3-dioxygenase-like lactoylglutathione lyase family enzyme